MDTLPGLPSVRLPATGGRLDDIGGSFDGDLGTVGLLTSEKGANGQRGLPSSRMRALREANEDIAVQQVRHQREP